MKKKKAATKKLPKFDLEESVKKLFPPVSRMGHSTPKPYDNNTCPPKVHDGQHIYSTSL